MQLIRSTNSTTEYVEASRTSKALYHQAGLDIRVFEYTVYNKYTGEGLVLTISYTYNWQKAEWVRHESSRSANQQRKAA